MREWRLIGPLGPLDHPAPLRVTDPGGPEVAPRATHPSSWGEDLAWRPFRRQPHSLLLFPTRELAYEGSGVAGLLAWVRRPAAGDGSDLALEVLASGPVQVWWNGTLVHEELVRALGEDEDRVVVPVTVHDGWNALLLRFPNEPVGLAARLVTRDGGRADVEELPADAELPELRSSPAGRPFEAEPRPDGFDRVAWMLEQVARGRPDRALAEPEPEDEAVLRPWLWVRYRALDRAPYLPSEVRRRSLLAVEERMEATGGVFPETRAARADRLGDEDRPAEALAEIDALLAAHPDVPAFHLTRAGALAELDPEGELSRACFAAMARRFPRHAGGERGLAGLCERDGDLAGARLHWRRALMLAGHLPAVQMGAAEILARAGGAGRDALVAELERWRSEETGNPRPTLLLRRIHAIAGDDAALERLLVAEHARRPDRTDPAMDLARFLASRGRVDEARDLFAGVLERKPGEHDARGAIALYGLEDPAERFFAAFAPDREEALAAGTDVRDASTAELLDSGIVYLYRDGSSHHRFHTITVALDRKGTELLHEERVEEHVRMARVLKTDGTVIEPMEVAGSWVMPSLEVGDAVELVWDEFTLGRPAVPPNLGWWRFSSFEKPFVRSRYVVFVPDGVPGELKSFHFDGEHEEQRWEDGTAHVFLAKDRPRQREEPLRPSYEEILPWLQYGGDRPIEHVEGLWLDRIEELTHVPADVAVELGAVVDGLDPELGPLERAEALWGVVTDRVLDFSGLPFASHVWLLRRGNPTFLFAALLERAGVPFEWAVLEKGVAPELDTEPARAFANRTGFDVPVLRIGGAGAGGGPVWHVGGGGRGERFGSVPDAMAGARALVLGTGGARFEEVPRDGLADSWDSDLAVTYTVAADGAAAVTGSFRITTPRGTIVREQVSQAGGVQRDAVARNIVGQLVPGLDLTEFDFPGLEERGGPLALSFAGRIPGFVRDESGEPLANLRLPPTQLSTGLGAAQRTWPLALRASNRERVRARIVPGAGWRVVGGPVDFATEREGFRHVLEVASGDEAWEWRRRFEIRGLMVPAEEMAGFLEEAGRREREESRSVRLEKVE